MLAIHNVLCRKYYNLGRYKNMIHSKKRSWKGYFLEFVMLFLAISLGFMADNFRENISEKNKEDGYIQSMIEDVEEDRVNIREVIDVNTQRVNALDSLLIKCFDFRGTEEEIFALNKYFVQVLIHPEFLTPADLTMQQLKNAGGMRLIKSKNSINEIIRYDTKLKKIASQQLYYENYQNRAIERGAEIFNIHKLLFFIRNPNNRFAPGYFELLNQNNSELKIFGNNVTMYKGIIEYYVTLLHEMNKQGELLIETLKSEYDLK